MIPQAFGTRGALVITGGARGIGAEIARLVGRSGTPVALLCHTVTDKALQVVADIEAGGGKAIALGVDVGNDAAVVSAFEIIDRTFERIAGLVNNAVDAGSPARLMELRIDQVERIFRTNVFGALLCAREAAKRMSTARGAGGGAFVHLSSGVAVKTGGSGAYVAFAASKAAVETMSLGLAKELAGEGIRSNVVRCGVIDTETRRTQPEERIQGLLKQVPLARMGQPGEVATAVRWLLSGEASYVTGAVLDVAGGY